VREIDSFGIETIWRCAIIIWPCWLGFSCSNPGPEKSNKNVTDSLGILY